MDDDNRGDGDGAEDINLFKAGVHALKILIDIGRY